MTGQRILLRARYSFEIASSTAEGKDFLQIFQRALVPRGKEITVTDFVDNMQTRRAELQVLRTLPELLTHHLQRRPQIPVYQFFDNRTKQWQILTVEETYERMMRWARAFAALGLKRGERVAMLLPNGIDAVCFDMAALSCALVPVPLHAIDTAGSSAYILRDSGARYLVTTKLNRWKDIRAAMELPDLNTVVITEEGIETEVEGARTVTSIDHWLSTGEGAELPLGPDPTDLAALVYTSGTTGKPKGVMLTHRNVMADIHGVLGSLCPDVNDVWLSFLPLSHTFERISTYYIALGMGNLVGFNRSIGLLQEDLRVIRPTLLMSVPRIYEKIYGKIQDRLATQPAYVRRLFDWAVEVGWRRFCRENGLPCPAGFSALFDPLVAGFLDKKVGGGIRKIFGGRPRVFISGGAAFNPQIAKTFLGLGVNILQGYGMTEASPVVCVNKLGSNYPQTVGVPLENLETKLGPNDELMVRGPNVMVGYWMRPEDTRAVLTEDGWLKTGDQADIYKSGHIRIKGRIKEIIVTSTGEKIPPADLEQAIEADPLFDQVMAVGEDRPYIACLAVVNAEQFKRFATELGKDPESENILMDKDVRNAALRRIKALTRDFPNYGIPRNVRLLNEAWSIENGLLTPTLKLKRARIRERYHKEIDELYGDRRA